MTKQDLVTLFRAIGAMGDLKGVKFSYGLSRNFGILKTEMEALEKATAPTEEFTKFDDARVALAKEYAEKDEKGEPKVAENEYVINEKTRKTFDKKFAELVADNKKVIDAREKQINEYNELLKSDAGVTLFKIKLEDVPKEISVLQMTQLKDIIEE